MCSLSRLRSLGDERAGPRFPDRPCNRFPSGLPPRAAHSPAAQTAAAHLVRDGRLLLRAGNSTIPRLFFSRSKSVSGGVARKHFVGGGEPWRNPVAARVVAPFHARITPSYESTCNKSSVIGRVNPTRWSSFDTVVSYHGTSKCPRASDPAHSEIAGRPVGNLTLRSISRPGCQGWHCDGKTPTEGPTEGPKTSANLRIPREETPK